MISKFTTTCNVPTDTILQLHANVHRETAMRTVVTVLIAVVLSGCGSHSPWLAVETGLLGRSAEVIDDEKCRSLGLEQETASYANCRLQLEQLGASRRAAVRARIGLGGDPAMKGVEQGGKVYDSNECIGPVIMGRCKGTILPNRAYHPTCHGAWLNGQCTGPMF